jgi:outer membrane protein, multidrug efflux system
MIKRSVGIVAMGLVLAAGGCKSVGPDYVEPQLTAPSAWASDLSLGLQTAEADLSQWWTVMNDPMLSEIVTQVMGSNLDLKQAEMRVREARLTRALISKNSDPSIDASGNYRRFTNSETTAPSRPRIDGGGEGFNLFQAGFDSIWELDVFGRTNRAVEAADADVETQQWARRDIMVSLAAEAARAYVELRTSQQRIVTLRQNVSTQEQTLQLTENRLAAGLTSELDVARAKSQLERTRSSLPLFEEQVRVNSYVLAVLAGQQPGAMVEKLKIDGAIPQVAASSVPVGVPMNLIRRRPDMRQAERAIASASARIGVATADLYPTFSLVGSIGLASKNLYNFFDGDSREWSFGPGIRWNVFDAGRIRTNIQIQEVRTEQAVVAYEQRLLTSLQEVDSAIVGLEKASQRAASLEKAVAAQQRAVDLADQLYRKGLTDFLSVLNAQRELFELQDAAVESKGSTTQRVVQLYKALGGGWVEEAPAVSEQAPVGQEGSGK